MLERGSAPKRYVRSSAFRKSSTRFNSFSDLTNISLAFSSEPKRAFSSNSNEMALSGLAPRFPGASLQSMIGDF
jgi:hypothetical protein